MKGTNDAWNNVYKPMHRKRLAFQVKACKGKNSESYTLIYNEFRDVVYQKPQTAF